MNRFQSFLGKSFLLLIPLFFPVHSIGKDARQHTSAQAGNWKFDLRAGSLAFQSEVPSGFLGRLNGVNIPVGVYAPAGVCGFRRNIGPHFEMGYQLDYSRVNGFVSQEDKTFKVSTTALANNFLILYKLRKEDQSVPRFNYRIYYKIGSLALNNNARRQLSDGSISPEPEQTESDSFIRKKALTTGLGLGASWNFSEPFSLVANLELNRSTYGVGDIFQLQTIFLHSDKTITRYALMSVGLSYTLGSVQHKTSYGHSKTRTAKRFSYKYHPAKKKTTRASKHLIWYKQKKRH